ncbi:MAG: hypothetical protein V3W19_08035 [Desulfatiglandales bacterium]
MIYIKREISGLCFLLLYFSFVVGVASVLVGGAYAIFFLFPPIAQIIVGGCFIGAGCLALIVRKIERWAWD